MCQKRVNHESRKKGSLKGNKGFPSECWLICLHQPVGSLTATGPNSPHPLFKALALPLRVAKPPQSCRTSGCLPHKVMGRLLEVSLLCRMTTKQEHRSCSVSNLHIIQACYGLWPAQKTTPISYRGICPGSKLQQPDSTRQPFRTSFPSLTSCRMKIAFDLYQSI